jgi:hypothetical protein
MSKPKSSVTTYHAAGHAPLGSPIHIRISSFKDFHGVKIIITTNFLLLYGIRD